MKRYPNTATILFYFFSMFFLGGFLYKTIEVNVLKQNPAIEKEALDLLVQTILQFTIYLILILGIAILMRHFYKDEFNDFKEKFLKYIFAGFIGWIAMYGLLIVYSIILTSTGYVPEVPANQKAIQDSFELYPLLMIPVLTLAAPFVEETIFRGIIFKSINESKMKYNTIIAFITSSCLFGSIHLMAAFLESSDIRNVIDGIPYFISGFALTFVYYKTKNIFVPMIMHFLYNSAATVIMYISMFLQDLLPEELSTSTIYILHQILHLQ